MNIIRATHLGMCFGVRDAITLAKQTAAREPVTVLGELVHNQAVLEELRRAGVRFEADPERVTRGALLITAHGASDRRIAAARATGLPVAEATCPLVHHAHRELRALVAAGYHPVIIGKRGHVEVNGLTEDLAECDIVLSETEVDGMRERPRFGVIAQTTQPLDRVERLTLRMRERFPGSEVKLRDTVCRPTRERQEAAVRLAQRSDVVVVIGGANSNNTLELVATCRKHCARVHQVQSAIGLHEDWFLPEDTVGITAGTSTLDGTIDEVEQAIRAIDEESEAVHERWSTAPAGSAVLERMRS